MFFSTKGLKDGNCWKISFQTAFCIMPLFIDTKAKENCNVVNDQAFSKIQMDTKPHVMRFKLDTGVQLNIITENKIKYILSVSQLNPAIQKPSTYSGELLSIKGTRQLSCKHKERKTMQEIYIVDTHAPPMLGLKTCLEMVADVFEGKGKFPGECTIHIDPNAVPVVYHHRKFHSCFVDV